MDLFKNSKASILDELESQVSRLTGRPAAR